MQDVSTEEFENILEEPDNNKPEKHDPKWTDYIIEDMEESELFDGIPKMDGLRRMVEKHVSPIHMMHTSISTSEGSYLTVIAIAQIELENGETYCAASDACRFSAPGEFENRLTALADTRAKSKAFREILRLRNVYSSEEVNNNDDIEEQSFITETQLLVVKRMTDELKIDLNKCMDLWLDDKPNSTRKMKVSQAQLILSKLSDIKHERAECPEEIK